MFPPTLGLLGLAVLSEASRDRTLVLERDAEAQEDCAAPATQIIRETMERDALWFTLLIIPQAPLYQSMCWDFCPRGQEPLVPGCEVGSGQPAVRSGLTLGRGTRLKVPLSFHL